jgi:hypothetical protein
MRDRRGTVEWHRLAREASGVSWASLGRLSASGAPTSLAVSMNQGLRAGLRRLLGVSWASRPGKRGLREDAARRDQRRGRAAAPGRAPVRRPGGDQCSQSEVVAPAGRRKVRCLEPEAAGRATALAPSLATETRSPGDRSATAPAPATRASRNPFAGDRERPTGRPTGDRASVGWDRRSPPESRRGRQPGRGDRPRSRDRGESLRRGRME